MSRSKHYDKLIKECRAIHDRKNHDYATETNPFSNFEMSATIASWFNDPTDKVFAVLIGIKLARLAELRNGKIPNNESIRDTFIDLTNYSALWGAYWDRQGGMIEEIKTQGQTTGTLNPHQVDSIPCPKCSLVLKNSEYFIYHAQAMHNAEYIILQNTIKYPDKSLFVLPPPTPEPYPGKVGEYKLDPRDDG